MMQITHPRIENPPMLVAEWLHNAKSSAILVRTVVDLSVGEHPMTDTLHHFKLAFAHEVEEPDDMTLPWEALPVGEDGFCSYCRMLDRIWDDPSKHRTHMTLACLSGKTR